jgi:hypothetical protein
MLDMPITSVAELSVPEPPSLPKAAKKANTVSLEIRKAPRRELKIEAVGSVEFSDGMTLQLGLTFERSADRSGIGGSVKITHSW